MSTWTGSNPRSSCSGSSHTRTSCGTWARSALQRCGSVGRRGACVLSGPPARLLTLRHASQALHIFLEYVPGGSIASLLQKFGCFSEKVIRVYTRQVRGTRRAPSVAGRACATYACGHALFDASEPRGSRGVDGPLRLT